MVQIWPMRVLMMHGVVIVPMAMAQRRGCVRMDVGVMTIVVAMGMFVRHRLVHMRVRVTLDQQQCYAGEKEQSRQRIH